MAGVTTLKALTGFFNSGDGLSVASDGGDTCVPTVAGVKAKRSLTDWKDELNALTEVEKRELAELVCEATGDTLIAK